MKTALRSAGAAAGPTTCYRRWVVDPRDVRARARSAWPITRHRLGEDPDDRIGGASPAECVAMVWQLTLDAWASSGQPIPDYQRANSPGRLVRGRAP